MRDDESLTTGQRIEYLRRRRGLSRRTLASLLGYSDEWLRKVEREDRPVERVSTLLRLADILSVNNLSTLIDLGPAAWSPNVELAQRPPRVRRGVRQALLSRTLPDGGGGRTGLDHATMRSQLSAMWVAWHASERRYTATEHGLTMMLERLDDDADHPPMQSDAFCLASSYLLCTGDAHFAQVAVDRALARPFDRYDLPGLYPCLGQFSEVLLRSGSHDESRKVAGDAAELMRPHVDPSADAERATLGYLQLIAAEAAAAAMDHNGAGAALDEAREVLTGLPVSLTAARVGAATVDVGAMRVELALGRPGRALRVADRSEGLGALGRAGRSAYYLTLASAHLTNEDPVAAAFALMQVERNCAEDIRFGAAAHSMITKALAQAHDRATVRHELTGLAERAGML